MIKRFIPFNGIRNNSEKKLARFVKSLTGMRPGNISLYEQAFIHSSVCRKTRKELPNNERLEFLGDIVLGAIVSEYIFKKYPNRSEGFLTQLRSKMVNRGLLHQLAVKFGLPDFLRADMKNNTLVQSSAYGDAFEALIGAIFLDKGYEKTKKFLVKKVINPYLDTEKLANEETDFKSKLQIYCQQRKIPFNYEVEKIEASSRGLYYRVRVVVNDKSYGPFEDKNKKNAEQKVAQIALSEINNG